MSKVIICIHGTSIKPEKEVLLDGWKKSNKRRIGLFN